jgi:hypothetical protein
MGLEPIDAVWRVVRDVEFISPAELGALTGDVEIRLCGRQDDGFDACRAAMVLELRHELGSPVDLDAFDRKRSCDDELGEERLGGGC